VYERLTPIGGKPTLVTQLVTQLVSGVWHGMFPGYWLFFASSAFMLHTAKVLYR
jgi:lysophospholipid acyltransferase